MNELADELGTGSRRQAYEVLRALLHALRDRLPVESAVKLGAQLPNGCGVAVRMLGSSSPEVRAVFDLAWNEARLLLIGVPARELRKS